MEDDFARWRAGWVMSYLTRPPQWIPPQDAVVPMHETTAQFRKAHFRRLCMEQEMTELLNAQKENK